MRLFSTEHLVKRIIKQGVLLTSTGALYLIFIDVVSPSHSFFTVDKEFIGMVETSSKRKQVLYEASLNANCPPCSVYDPNLTSTLLIIFKKRVFPLELAPYIYTIFFT